MSIVLDGTSGITSSAITTNSLTGLTTPLSVGQGGTGTTSGEYMFRNRIINGAMIIDQRNAGAAQTFIAGIGTYSVDRWKMYCGGANVTGQRVAGSGNTQYRYQFTGATSVASITAQQRIEQANSYDLAGQTATLSVDLSNSLLTTVSWVAYYANSADNFTSVTQFASGSWTVNSTITRYNAQISVPLAATTGIMIEIYVLAQTSGTWVLGNVQLEKGSTATSFENRPYGTELALCQRYYHRVVGGAANTRLGSGFVASTTSAQHIMNFPVSMRIAPSALEQSGTAGDYLVATGTTTTTSTSVPTFQSATLVNAMTVFTTGATLTAGQGCAALTANATAYLGWSAEL